jgi:hypothetical protein
MSNFPAISDRSAWLGSELADDPSWIYHFTPPELDELDAAMRSFVNRGVPLEQMRYEDFPLPTLGPTLQQCLAETGAASCCCAACRCSTTATARRP